jgi:acetoin utilization protein AcuB
MSRAELKRRFLKHVFADQLGLFPAIAVGAVMTPRPFTVSADCPAAQLVKLFHEKQFRHFLVSDEGLLAGIISDRDVIPYFGRSARPDDLKRLTAADLMSTELVTVRSTTLLVKAIERMVNAGINSLPVVERGEVIGIVTSTDIFLTLEQVLQRALAAQEASIISPRHRDCSETASATEGPSL